MLVSSHGKYLRNGIQDSIVCMKDIRGGKTTFGESSEITDVEGSAQLRNLDNQNVLGSHITVIRYEWLQFKS